MLFDECKTILLKEANEKIQIYEDMSVERNRNLIFVFVPPKVGSTSLVSSIRLWASHKFNVLHIHNEIMLKVLYDIQGITVNEMIEYNKSLGKQVYVIDVFRSPVEHKMSAFFETLSSFHFNTPIENLKNVKVEKLIQRFNHIFPYIANNDYYRERYELDTVVPFDFEKKYILQRKNDINYIKLRLKDSNEWGKILSGLLNTEIRIVKDYETENKPIKDIYKAFKDKYRLPANLLELAKNSESLNHYYSEEERAQYFEAWNTKITSEETIIYTTEEFKLYNEISVENQCMSDTHTEHYIDLGCTCLACSSKRARLLVKIKRGETIDDKIIHTKAKVEFVNKKIDALKQGIPALMNRLRQKTGLVSKPKNIIKNSFGKNFGTNLR
jgi:hypothetical protein